MLQHIIDRRNNLINTLEKSYYTPQEVLKKSKEVYQELGESPEFQSLEDEGIITDFDSDNSKKDQEEGKDVGLEKDEVKKSIDQLNHDLIKATTFEQRKAIQIELKDRIEKAVDREIYGRSILFKSVEDNEFDEIVKGFEDLEKGGVGSGPHKVDGKIDYSSAIHTHSKEIAEHAGISHDEYQKLHPGTKEELARNKFEKSEDLEKGLGNKIHKYISKIGNRYIYENKNVVSSLNDLREYHKQKTGLDSIKRSLSKSPDSPHLKDIHETYKKKATDFKKLYGHDHDSDEADEKKRLTVNGMLSHIENRTYNNKLARLEKSDEEGLIKELIVRNELVKGEVNSK